MTNAERQKAHRGRMKSQGYTQALVWIPDTPEAKRAIHAAAKSLREEGLHKS